MYWPNLKFASLPVPEIIAIGIWGEVQTPILEKGRPQGSGMVLFERALATSYKPSIVTFRLSLRV